MDSEVKYTSHPSYGMVSFSRISCGGKTKLFGSAIRDHHTIVRLRIVPGEIKHDVGKDWYFGSDGKPFIVVELSALQFSELLTQMNIGSGVPCTIRRVNGKEIPEPPDDMVESDRIKENFDSRLKDRTSKFSEYASTLIDKLSEPGPIKASEKKEIMDKLRTIKMELEQNTPFYLRCFEESADRMVSTAKAEVDAFVTHVIHQAGIKTLSAASPEEQRNLLTEGKDHG